MPSYKFLVSGRVQGVYYRANIAKNAKKVGLSGYVKNLEDGRVEASVTCNAGTVAMFEAILRKGSPISKVSALKVLEISEIFTGEFVVRK